MLQKTDNNFRVLFLIQFTKELIKHSKGEVFVLDQTLKEEKKDLKKNVKAAIEKPNLSKEFKDLGSSIVSHEKNIARPLQMPPPQQLMVPQKIPISPFMRVSKIRLPPRLSYLRPIPRKVEIDLGKLNPLIKDFAVQSIQCNGPDEDVIVEGRMGRKPTGIKLTKDEIDEVIEKFSKAAKIPVDRGVVRIFVGNLNLLAITSEVVSPKFLIKKVSLISQRMMSGRLPR